MTRTKTQLRVFAGASKSEPPAKPHCLTLSQMYQQSFVPLWIRSQALSEKTELLYQQALAWWKKITGDPALANIDDFTTARFVEQLLLQPGRKHKHMAIATVRKHCAAIEKLLSFTGPKTREKHARKNLALLDSPPTVDRPSPDYDPPSGDFSFAEVQSLVGACASMQSPKIMGVAPEKWWQALLVTAVYSGLRIGQLMRLEWSDLQAPFLMVPARSSKRRRGKKQYLPAHVIADLEAIRTTRRLIFEFPNWERNPRWLQMLFKRLAAAAGIPAERRFGFHGLRKCHATLIADGAGEHGSVNAVQLAQQSLGHSSAGTTTQHYISGSVQEKLTAAAIERLPNPKPQIDTRQKMLF